jgi:multicomponent Na+:H+ antiporter subunit F
VITPLAIVSVAALVALVILSAALLLTTWRVIVGPTLADRVLALDMLVGIAIGFIAVIAIETGFALYIDIAISLGLVGFLATVAFARFILVHNGTAGSGSAAEMRATQHIGRPSKRGRRSARRSAKGPST